MLITLLQFHSLEEVNAPIRCPAEGDHLTMLGTRSGLPNVSNDSSDVGSWLAKGNIVKTWVDRLLALKEISKCVHSAMHIGSGRPANANKVKHWRLKLHENETQSRSQSAAIGVRNLQFVSGNQLETHLLNASVKHGFFRLGSPSKFCHTCGYGHALPSICNTLRGMHR